MAANEHRFARHAEVVAALADSALVPIEPPEEADADRETVGTAAWLRAHVARFAHGPEHARRRAVVEAELARLDEGGLRRAATECARKAGAGADPRIVAVRALAGELGLPDPDAVAGDVALVSGVYFGGSDPAADEAVGRLVAAYRSVEGSVTDGFEVPDGDGEAVANRISILVQAFEATGSLVEHARAAAAEHGIGVGEGVGGDRAGSDATVGFDVDGLVFETLRHDPPVRAMRRVALRATTVAGVEIDAGDLVTLDIAAANRDPEVFVRSDEFDAGRGETPSLTFGSAPRRCPGVGHALALATRILTEDER